MIFKLLFLLKATCSSLTILTVVKKIKRQTLKRILIESFQSVSTKQLERKKKIRKSQIGQQWSDCVRKRILLLSLHYYSNNKMIMQSYDTIDILIFAVWGYYCIWYYTFIGPYEQMHIQCCIKYCLIESSTTHKYSKS